MPAVVDRRRRYYGDAAAICCGCWGSPGADCTDAVAWKVAVLHNPVAEDPHSDLDAAIAIVRVLPILQGGLRKEVLVAAVQASHFSYICPRLIRLFQEVLQDAVVVGRYGTIPVDPEDHQVACAEAAVLDLRGTCGPVRRGSHTVPRKEAFLPCIRAVELQVVGDDEADDLLVDNGICAEDVPRIPVDQPRRVEADWGCHRHQALVSWHSVHPEQETLLLPCLLIDCFYGFGC